jgi:hypothetical protein
MHGLIPRGFRQPRFLLLQMHKQEDLPHGFPLSALGATFQFDQIQIQIRGIGARYILGERHTQGGRHYDKRQPPPHAFPNMDHCGQPLHEKRRKINPNPAPPA